METKRLDNFIFHIDQTKDKIKVWREGMRKTLILQRRNNGCMECISHRIDDSGYPGVGIKVGGIRTRMYKVHRLLYCLFSGIEEMSLIAGLVVRHKCDNRLCSNPEHLETGSHYDNMMDRKMNGRDCFGEKNGMSKLSELNVQCILGSEMENDYLCFFI